MVTIWLQHYILFSFNVGYFSFHWCMNIIYESEWFTSEQYKVILINMSWKSWHVYDTLLPFNGGGEEIAFPSACHFLFKYSIRTVQPENLPNFLIVNYSMQTHLTQNFPFTTSIVCQQMSVDICIHEYGVCKIELHWIPC